jgi:hypothetical protein
MSLTSGTKLGPYEILSPAGAGGMGEVYREDNEFAAVTSFNWLSFKGDPKHDFRDEQGVLLR